MIEGLPPIVLVVSAALSVVGGALSVLAAARSWPVRMRRGLARAIDAAEGAEEQAAAIAGKWTATKVELETIREQVEQALDSIEKKRRSVAATQSNLDRREAGQPAEPTDRKTQLREIARARGYSV